MRHPRIGGGRVEYGLVGLAGVYGKLHGVVDGENGVLGSVGAVLLDVLVAEDWEGVQDVGRVIAGATVEVEESGVEFAAELEAALIVPGKVWTIATEVFGKGFHRE